MTEFESRLLRLIGLGILTLASVGLVIARTGGFFAIVAVICMLFIVGELLPGLVRWLGALWTRIKERWSNDWRHQLGAPARAERDTSQPA